MTNLAIRTVMATRYVAPLREGGSLPEVMEADDLDVDSCSVSRGRVSARCLPVC